MTDTFVALDLETTGLDQESDRITEIGALRFRRDGEVVEVFETLVNPGREIPYFIETLTGVTNEAVRGAPAIAEAGRQLLAFAGSDPIVGQNIAFDLGCLRREGVFLSAEAIDTAHFSRLLLPRRAKRGLVGLANSLGVEAGVHHRALPDARTAAAIFVALARIAGELREDERFQLARLVSMENLALAEVIGGAEWSRAPITERHLPSVRAAGEYLALSRREPRLTTPAAAVCSAFDAAASVVERFEERTEQREMAEAVRLVLSEGGHLMVEAGTGVGKSLAYLVPAALHALRNGERVVISTNTHQLQEQLLAKDIPALKRILVAAGAIADEEDLRASVLKGRSNYLCLRRWVASYGAGLGDVDFARLASSMLLWLPETDTGDRSELNLDPAERQTWARFSAQETDCLTRPNSYVREGNCFLLRARKSAESAHILIVNHALLLADLASGGSAIPQYDHLIIDEAHNLEEAATSQFGGNMSRRRLFEALDGVHRRSGRDSTEGGVVALLKALPPGPANEAARALEDAALRATLAAGPFFDALGTLVPRGEDERLLVSRGVRNREEWARAETAWAPLERTLREIGAAASTAVQLLTMTAMTDAPDALAGEIESAARRVDEARLFVDSLLPRVDDEVIVWVSRERDGTGGMNAAPLDVGPRLWADLFARRRTVVATSATLAASGSMEYAAKRLGFEDPIKVQLGSPYDYRASTLLAAFTDVPEPNAPGYAEAVAASVTKLVLAAQGRSLALFTSHAMLRRVAEIARPHLESEGIVVLVQDLQGSARQLQENLKENSRTVIFGTQSFWEGVDIRGDALSMLIITRLPFAVPTEPVYKARSEQYDSPFQQYALPGAILKFRQGFGRLIRDREDRGVVAVMDRRIWEKGYGAQFVSALPDCTKIRADSATIAERAAEWLS
ncbi:MAG: helicase C-terminal domain-containing protein [Tepidiformaceae bacterium]